MLGREIPVAVAVADVDGDGNADVVTANLDRSVSVLLGRGDGRLARGVPYLAPGTHEAIAAADLNGDGAADFAVADADSRVSVLLNAGGGGLRPATRFAAPRSNWGLEVADMDGDGRLDVVTVSNDSEAVAVLRGLGDGRLGPAERFPAGPDADDLAVGDVDGDGDGDAVVTAYDHERLRRDPVLLLLGRGNGTLGLPVRVAYGDLPSSPLLRDLDADGDLDLAWTNYYSGSRLGVSVALGDGVGGFAPARSVRALAGATELAAGDVNADGKPDLLASASVEESPLVAVLLGAGDGSFALRGRYTAGANVNDAALADFDRDGRLDIVAALQTAGDVAVLRGAGDGSFGPPRRFATGPTICEAPYLRGERLATARRYLRLSHCRLGRVRHVRSRPRWEGRVLRQRPAPETTLPRGARVHVVVGASRIAG